MKVNYLQKDLQHVVDEYNMLKKGDVGKDIDVSRKSLLSIIGALKKAAIPLELIDPDDVYPTACISIAYDVEDLEKREALR